METKDLRIGNFVKNNREDLILTVKTINYDDIDLYCEKDDKWEYQYIENIDGIELTEEILINWCGFEKLYEGQFAFWIASNNYFGVKYTNNTFKSSKTQLKYLHELQNVFYFANNFTELKINLV